MSCKWIYQNKQIITFVGTNSFATNDCCNDRRKKWYSFEVKLSRHSASESFIDSCFRYSWMHYLQMRVLKANKLPASGANKLINTKYTTSLNSRFFNSIECGSFICVKLLASYNDFFTWTQVNGWMMLCWLNWRFSSQSPFNWMLF